MKIALVSPGAIPAQTANSIQVMKMAQALAAEGHALCVFAPGRDPGMIWEQLAAHYGLRQRFEIRWLLARAAFRRYDFAFAALGAAQAWGAELVYTRLPQAATLAAGRGLATIFELHDMPSGTMGPWLMRRFLKSAGARCLVVNTKYLAGEIRKRYSLPEREDSLVLAPNGVDLERYAKLPEPSAARKTLGFSEGFTAGYTGHLYQGRGVELILELARRLPQMQFLLVGGRPEHVAAMKTKASQLKNVRFTGFVPNAELPLYQAACDALLMPYDRQVAASGGGNIAPYTNPLKMFEYLASGRPILVSDLPILREVLTKDNAVILPSGDADAWAAALSDLQKSPAQAVALAQAARQTAAEFTWEKRARHILRGLQTSAKI